VVEYPLYVVGLRGELVCELLLAQVLDVPVKAVDYVPELLREN